MPNTKVPPPIIITAYAARCISFQNFPRHENEALNKGLIDVIAPTGQHVNEALAIAERVAAGSPLGVTALMTSVQTLIDQGPQAALDGLPAEVQRLTGTQDFQEGFRSFIERRDPVFEGK